MIKENGAILKAGCILINLNNREIALVCRNGEYSFPKGHLEENETLQQCALRETKEETGHDCHLVDERVRAILHYTNARGEKVENYFYLAIDDGLTKDEIDEKDKELSVWRNYREIDNLLEYQVLKDFWYKVKKELNYIIEKEEDKEFDCR